MEFDPLNENKFPFFRIPLLDGDATSILVCCTSLCVARSLREVVIRVRKI